jgi:hypothetical protein
MLIPEELSRSSSDTNNKRRNCSKHTRSRRSRCSRDSSHLAAEDLAAAGVVNRSFLMYLLAGADLRRYDCARQRTHDNVAYSPRRAQGFCKFQIIW